MSNIDQLRSFILATEKFIGPIKSYNWSGETNQQFFAFLQRAAVVRQWESLVAVRDLVDLGHGHFGVTFLRPAYEELVWLEYLLSIPEVAPRLAFLLAGIGVAKSVTQQADYLGREVSHSLGWPEAAIKHHQGAGVDYESQINRIGKELGWGRKLPTFKWLSAKVGRQKEYGFLFHATSSFVHFSPHELCRRVWGKHGEVEIASSNFKIYWEDFAAYWSLRIFIELCATQSSILPVDAELDESVLTIIHGLSPVPIITPEELEAWPEPPQTESFPSG